MKHRLTKADLKVPALLIALSLVPMFGGVARLMTLASKGPVALDSARFAHAPLPVLIHIFSATLFSILGAFQFSRGFRLRWSGLHRRLGRVLGVCGLLTAASGLWMTAFYAIPASMQGPLLYPVRLAVGSAMFAFIIIAWRSILRRDVARHEAFVIRAYALGQGAGTQVVVLLPWMLISGQSGGLTRDLLMTLSWLINIAFAEVIIRRRVGVVQRTSAAWSSH
jgi:uncharacterized membrane protein